MSVGKRIVLLRHGERMDRFVESQGGDWLSTAPRPQDPTLSEPGSEQIKEVGKEIKKIIKAPVKILASPLIRCVQTATICAGEIAYPTTISVEYGLAEDAKSMRGREEGERKPVWTPLILDLRSLREYSTILDSTPSMVELHHERVQDGSHRNEVREFIEDEPSLMDEAEVTSKRCKNLLMKIKEFLASKELSTLILVSHGAITKVLAAELQGGESKLTGKLKVASWCAFDQDSANPDLFMPIFDEWQSASYEGAEKKQDSVNIKGNSN